MWHYHDYYDYIDYTIDVLILIMLIEWLGLWFWGFILYTVGKSPLLTNSYYINMIIIYWFTHV